MRRALSTLLLIAGFATSANAYTFVEDSTPRLNPERGYRSIIPAGRKFLDGTVAEMSENVTDAVNPSRTGSGPLTLLYDRFYYPSTGMSAAQENSFADNLRAVRDGASGVKVILRPRFNSPVETIAFVRTSIDEYASVITGTCTVAGNTQCTNGGGSCTTNADCDYCDIIAGLEAGFVGQFGEWHTGQTSSPESSSPYVCEAQFSAYEPRSSACASTCNGSNLCTNTPVNVSCTTDADCVGADTRAVYDYAMLKLCPTGDRTRAVCFRNSRWRFIKKYNLTAARAPYDGSDASRACFYDDGLHCGVNDGATLRCDEFPTNEDYINVATKYTFSTGETNDQPSASNVAEGTCQSGGCNGSNAARCDPDTAGTCPAAQNIAGLPAGTGQCVDYFNATRAIAHAKRIHLNSISDGYSPAGGNVAASSDMVIDLQTDGTINSYKNILGYRFVLDTATLPVTDLPKGNPATFAFTMKNDGAANLFNKRTAYLCFEQCAENVACATETCVALVTDPRRWDSGLTTSVSESVTVPAGLANGTWDVNLWLPDQSATLQTPKMSLAGQVLYSIRLNNTKGDPSSTNFNVWDTANGWNKLGTVAVVDVSPPVCVTNADCNEKLVDNVCTTDECVGGTSCTHAYNTTSCDDGFFCTLTDTCSVGTCSGSGAKCNGATPVCNEAADTCGPAGGTTVELWSPLALTFTDGTETYTDTNTSPQVFRDRRIVAQFTSPAGLCAANNDCNGAATCSGTGQCVYVRDGYWNGDNAFASSSGKITTFPAKTGSKFVVKWMPLYVGDWSYSVKFCSGTNAFDSDSATCSGFSDITSRLSETTSGSFTVLPSTKASTDMRSQSKGLVTNRKNANAGEGAHYLSYAGDQPGYFVINGLGVPEGLFNYKGFDNTKFITNPTRVCATGSTPAVKDYTNHIADWVTGDPNWVCGTGASADSTGQSQAGCTVSDATNAGKGIIGVINYMASLNANSFYIVINSTPDGDTSSVAPFVDMDNSPVSTRQIYDISKLAQWGIVLEYMNTKGMCPTLVMGEQETYADMNDSASSCESSTTGCIGTARKLFYHELMTRFGHIPCLLISGDEEGGFTQAARASIVQAFKKYDPYDHPVTLSPTCCGSTARMDETFEDSSGTPSVALHHPVGSRQAWDDDLDFVGLQLQLDTATTTYAAYNECMGGGGRRGWRDQSNDDGMRWMCGMLEPQGCDHDDTASMTACRKEKMWPGVMGGFGLWLQYLREDTGNDSTATDQHVWDLCVNDFSDTGTTNALVWTGIINTFMNRAGRALESLTPQNTEAFVTDNATSIVYQMGQVGETILAYQDDLDNITVKTSALTNGQTYAVTWMNPLTGTEYICNHSNCGASGTITDGGTDIAIGSCSGCTADEALTIERQVTPPTTTTTSTTVPATTTTTLMGTDCASTSAPSCMGDCAAGYNCLDQGNSTCACIFSGTGHGAHGINMRGSNARGIKAK